MARLVSLVAPGNHYPTPLPEMWRMPRFLHHRRKPTTGVPGLDKMVPVDGICSSFSAEKWIEKVVEANIRTLA